MRALSVVALALVLAGCGSSRLAAGTPAPEPSTTVTTTAALPSPNGSYTPSCDYALGDSSGQGGRFTADAEITNTGNVTALYELRATWYLQGGQSVSASKKIRIGPGGVERVGISKPATIQQILAYQNYAAGDPCTSKVVILLP